MYPRLLINKEALANNAKVLSQHAKTNNLTTMAVTKSFCAIPEVVDIIVENGFDYIADSRIENLIMNQDSKAEKILLRLPMKSQANLVAKHVDISLNSELDTIAEIQKEAKKLGVTHKIILMIDLGDLREGVFYKSDYKNVVKEILKFENINLFGIGVNLTCYGGIIPKHDNLKQLVDIKDEIEKEFSITINMVSGGNSSSYYLIDKKELPKGINNLRYGEILVLGRETAYGDLVKGLREDVFKLEAEVIELKKKPSAPIGEIGMDAFGNTPSFTDKGEHTRCIVAIGRQDVTPDALTLKNDKLEIIGASSDHLILECNDPSIKVGSIIEFSVDYQSLLETSTSNYVDKVLV